jgi:hypothetical protein
MIYVIGAGWYGCHISLELLKAGYQVRIVDKANAFFTGSSGKNQNRLHLGYHYPRSFATIAECKRGFEAFKANYPTLSTPISNNLYLIASGSKTTVSDFSATFDCSGQPLHLQGTPFRSATAVESRMFVVEEEYIDNVAAATFFQEGLSLHFLQLPPSSFSSMDTIREVLGIQAGDWIVNCTYNHLEPVAMDHYELYCSFVYHIPGDLFAVTVMDGEYFSIYPYDLEKRLYTVTSVREGVVWRGSSLEAAGVCDEGLKTRRAAVEAEVSMVLPTFPTIASYQSHFLSWKTKPVTEEDDRSLRYSVGDHVISLYGGKITGMFDAARLVLETVSKCA